MQHTHTQPFNGSFPGLPRWAGTTKVKPIWILLKQETVSGSGISCAVCKSAPRSRQITMPAPHHWSCLQAGCPSYRPTNSVKALKAIALRQYRMQVKIELLEDNTHTHKWKMNYWRIIRIHTFDVHFLRELGLDRWSSEVSSATYYTYELHAALSESWPFFISRLQRALVYLLLYWMSTFSNHYVNNITVHHSHNLS